MEMGSQTSVELPHCISGGWFGFGAPRFPSSLPVPILSLQLTEGVRATLARRLSPPITTAPTWKEPLEPSRGELEGQCHSILTFRGGRFEIKALVQAPPLSLQQVNDAKREGTRTPLEGGMEL